MNNNLFSIEERITNAENNIQLCGIAAVCVIATCWVLLIKAITDDTNKVK